MPNISDFKAALVGGGARPNLFQVGVTFPAFVSTGALASRQIPLLASSASIPSSKLRALRAPFMGREVKLGAEREFDDWRVTFYNDTGFLLRNAFEQWQNTIQQADSLGGLQNPGDYQMTLQVYQLDRSGNILQYYDIVDAFPTEVGEIRLSFEAANNIEAFDVNFTYNYFTNPQIPAGASVQVNISANLPI